MTLQRLTLTDFRNLESVDLSFAAGINLFSGENGSGKTSLLEAIYLLSLVRSFRSKKLKTLIRHQCESFVLHARFLSGNNLPCTLGIQRKHQAEETEILFQGRRPEGIAELTHYLPVQLINQDTFSLLEGSPANRRRFLDWGVFHVEPAFLAVWQRFNRALKQRNILLRHARMDALQMQLWEAEIARCGEEVTHLRKAYFEQLLPFFDEQLKQLLQLDSVRISFQQGWDKQQELLGLLEQNRERDSRQGFTQVGPQRADLRISVDQHPAMDVLSRGQQKLVVSALKLAQGKLLSARTGKRCIYLVDDLAAELDQQHRRVFCSLLEQQQAQVFITSVDTDALQVDWQHPEQISRFHVKQGRIQPA